VTDQSCRAHSHAFHVTSYVCVSSQTWVHWVLYNIPPSTTSLEDSVPASHLPSGTKQALNDWKTLGYGGPSPPIGTHRYFFKLYALDMVLPDLGDQATKSDVEHAMKGHIMGEAELVGRYKKAERTA
jgi:Raf kinase inhibitor-like YbhB/YbcL family protein